MVVGVLRLTLYIHGASSLKDKRQVLRKVTDRLRARYNVGVAEVGDNDVWQRAVVGIVAVANDSRFINEVLDKCVRDAGKIAEIVNREMEIETYSEMKRDWAQKPDVDAVEGSRPQTSGLSDEDERDEDDEGWLKEEDLP
jgi:uncharacterized protein YlxP (DUF503 family)